MGVDNAEGERSSTQPECNEGWTNYETYLVYGWLTRTPVLTKYWDDAAREAWDETVNDFDDGFNKHATNISHACRALGQRLETEISLGAPILGKTVWADMLRHAITQVEWCEIAEAFIQVLPPTYTE